MDDKILNKILEKNEKNILNLFKDNIEDKDGSTWVHFATWYNNDKLIDILIYLKHNFD